MERIFRALPTLLVHRPMGSDNTREFLISHQFLRNWVHWDIIRKSFGSMSKNIAFEMFEVGDDDDAYDDHQEPRGDFIGRHHIPLVNLIRIFPSPEIG